ncbi:MAG: response regulator transcription factor [Candidatus Omnitrophica bacterium]|nr:response regulator transcription factor [Candidatus Omnitrophota bacterium]
MNITVAIADDHAVVREGIKAVLQKTTAGIEVVAEAANGQQALDIARNSPADIYLLDISMPLLNGLEVAERLSRMSPQCRVIILSMHDDKSSVEKAFQSGARGYLVKENAAEEIVQAVREVYAGKFFLSPEVSRYIVQDFLGGRGQYVRKARFRDLTGKEKEVLQLVAEGFSSKEIAGNLNIALATVQVHRRNIMRKLDIHKQADLVRFALKEGIARL